MIWFQLSPGCTALKCGEIKRKVVLCVHISIAKWQLAVYAGGHTAAAWLVWVDVSLSVVRTPLPTLPAVPPSLPPICPPLCCAAVGLSHSQQWKPRCHKSGGEVRERLTQSYGDVCRREMKREEEEEEEQPWSFVKWQHRGYDHKQ